MTIHNSATPTTAGTWPTSTGGKGGDGILSPIGDSPPTINSGNGYYYAGGGGGGAYKPSMVAGNGGLGGGGGGGGAHPSRPGGSGGSGHVVVRYKIVPSQIT